MSAAEMNLHLRMVVFFC